MATHSNFPRSTAPGLSLGVLSLFLGLLGLALCWFAIVGTILSGAGLVTGLFALGVTRSDGHRPAPLVAGLILSVVGLGLSIWLLPPGIGLLR
jgi:hypothetical protein